MSSRLLALLCTAALVTSACIGATDRADFEAEVRARGGGVSAQAVREAVDAVAAESEFGLLLLRSLFVDPSSGLIQFEVQDPNAPDVVDRWTLRDGVVVDVSPVQVRLSDPRVAFRAGDVPVDDLDAIADGALKAFGADGAWVETFTVTAGLRGSSAFEIVFQVGAPRAVGVVAYRQGQDAFEVVRQ